MHTREEKLEAFGRLLDVLDRLRKECPWDRKQTNESLRPNTIEEVYELCDALMKNDRRSLLHLRNNHVLRRLLSIYPVRFQRFCHSRSYHKTSF